MPVKQNGYYNNPQIGQAFANLGQIFAPPSGSDAYGYAKAAEAKASAERKKAGFDSLAKFFTPEQLAGVQALGADYLSKYPEFDLYNRSARPGAQPEDVDLSIAAIRGAPNSFRGLNIKEAGDTERANIKESGDTLRNTYTTDQNNLTSRANNTADNSRALTQTGMQQSGETTRAMLSPVAAGATRFTPPSLAAMFDVPETQTGVVNLNPGDRAFLPGGGQLNGAPKPRTDSEVRGGIIESLSPEEQRAIGLQGVPVEQVVGEDGQPKITFRPDAVGSAPYNKPSGNAQVSNYRTPDGKVGTARFDPTVNDWLDTSSGQRLPQGSQTYSANLQGDKASTGLGPTTANNTQANNRDAEATAALNTLDVYENLIRNNPGSIGIVGLIRGTAQNAVASAQDLAKAFGKSAPQVAQAAETLRVDLGKVAPELFDTTIPEADFLQGTLAYAIARTENPSGEVSRQAYERAFDRLQGGGLLANQKSALAQISAYRKVLQAQRSGTNVLRNPGQARTDTGYQPPPGAQPTEPQVIQTPAGPVTITPLEP